MRMIMAVVPKKSADTVLDALVNAGYTATYSETRGGMLRQSQISLFIAVQEQEVDKVLEILKTYCKTHTRVHDSQVPHRFTPNSHPDIVLGGGVVFVWTLDKFENL